MPSVEVGPNQLGEMVHDPRKRLAVLHDHVGERDPREDPVAFWNMAAERETAAFLAAEHGIGLGHFRPDVLEANLQLVHLDAEPLTQLVDHRGRCQRPDDVPLLSALLDQIHHQQGHHLELVDEAALFVDDANPIRVTVVRDAEVEAAGLHPRHRLRHVVRDRLGVHAAEAGVAFGVDLLDGGLATVEERPDIALAGAVHRLVQDAQAGGFDGIEVDEPIQLGRIGGLRVEDLDQALPLGVVESHLTNPAAALDPLNLFLEPVGDLGGGRAGVLRFVFQATEVVGVVAGRDDQATTRLPVEDRIGGDLGRRRGIDDQDFDPVGRQHLGDLAGEEV